MNFQELVAVLKKQDFQELRACSENFFEAVAVKTKLIEVENILISYFGLPMKPAGIKSSGDANRFSKPYGGVRQDQTMYFRKEKTGNEFAFLWPWSCGSLVTLKVISEGKSQEFSGKLESPAAKPFWKVLLGR